MTDTPAAPTTPGTANERLRVDSWTDPDHGFAVVPLQDAEREVNLLYGIIERLAEARSTPAEALDALKALNRLDEIAPTLWQQQPKGHPMMPMQIIIRGWVATIRAALSPHNREADHE